jgi:hypothetical protein
MQAGAVGKDLSARPAAAGAPSAGPLCGFGGLALEAVLLGLPLLLQELKSLGTLPLHPVEVTDEDEVVRSTGPVHVLVIELRATVVEEIRSHAPDEEGLAIPAVV